MVNRALQIKAGHQIRTKNVSFYTQKCQCSGLRLNHNAMTLSPMSSGVF